MSPRPAQSQRLNSSLWYQRVSIDDVASSQSDEHSDEVRWLIGSPALRRALDCSSGLTRAPSTVEAVCTVYPQGVVVGMNRHSNRHTSEEVQVAFKVLMTHWILRVA